jgi:hypothetical protein
LTLPSQGRKLSRAPGVIPKPRTAYELFRAHIGQTVLPADIPFCTKQVTVSRIASYIWQRLPPRKLALFDNLFQEEQQSHQRWHPDYVIQDRCASPSGRTKAKPVEGDGDAIKCKKIAELLLANIQRDELATLIRDIVGGGPQPGWLKIAPAPTSRPYASQNMEVDATGAIVASPTKKVASQF